MLRKLFLTVVVLFVFPVFANAWTLNTWVKSTGGNIVVRNGTPQTSVNGSIFKTYTTHQSFPVTVNAYTGYTISKVTYNGVSQSLPISSGRMYTVQGFGNPATQSVYATFTAQLLSITASVGTGGSVTPRSINNVYYSQKPAVPIKFTFTPSTSFSVQRIIGVPVGAAVSPALPAAVNVPVTVTFPTTFTFTDNVTLSGTFSGPPVANAGAPQTVFPGSMVILNGSASTGTIMGYAWAQTSGPAAVALTPSGSTATFTPSVAGTYTFKLTVTGGSTASTTIVVTSDPFAVALSQCVNCHTSNGVGAGVYGAWASSKHSANLVMCAKCHVGTDTGGHPGPVVTDNVCKGCHFDNSGNLPSHPVTIGGNPCTNCHNPHSTVASFQSTVHYNNITSGMYPASYVTSRATCADCHYEDSATTNRNASIRHVWYSSAHAAITELPWIKDDFKTMSGCVQCHTTTGFIAYSTGKVTAAWGNAADKTKEVLTCIGCHKDITTGAVRSITPVRPYADDSYINRNVGESNICMDCHSGVKNGQSINVKLNANADFTNQAFIDPHYLAAGGTLHGKAGYQFSGQTYAFYSTNTHRTIGIGNNNGTGNGGPCIACHKNSINGHTFQAGFKNGVIPVCANCHGTFLTADQLTAKKADYANALNVLRAGLSTKGFAYYSTANPRFTNTNWGGDQAGSDTMGAAFNYALLRTEPGGYAHNSAYAKQLIFDSIDYLHNGAITGDIGTALSSLVSSGAITQQDADSVSAYKANASCGGCHAIPPATGAHLAHTDGTGAAYGSDANNSVAAAYRCNCGTCHPMDVAKHGNGVVDIELYNPAATGFKSNNPANASRTGTGNTTVCLNIYCHSSGQDASVRTYTATPSWGGTFTGNRCAGCHGDPPVYPSGGAYSANANSHYTQSWDNGQFVEGGHLVGLHFDNIRKDPADSVQPLFPKAGGFDSGAGHGDPATSTTISCPTCHAATVNAPSLQSAPGTAFDCAACHGLQPSATIADKSRHVNGIRDVVFMTGDFRSRAQLRLANFTSVIKPLGWTRNKGYKSYSSFDSVPFSGNYNPGDKSCVTVCHLNQSARWGDPSLNCISCHSDL